MPQPHLLCIIPNTIRMYDSFTYCHSNHYCHYGRTTQAVTPVISSQLCSSSSTCSMRTTFTGDNFATLYFTTTRVRIFLKFLGFGFDISWLLKTVGATNPRCVFWDDQQGKWTTEGVDTHTQVAIEDREFKSYGVVCLSRHLSSFAVIADIEVRVSQLLHTHTHTHTCTHIMLHDIVLHCHQIYRSWCSTQFQYSLVVVLLSLPQSSVSLPWFSHGKFHKFFMAMFYLFSPWQLSG